MVGNVQRNDFRVPGSAGIAGGHVKAAQPPRLPKLPGERVLAPSATDEQDVHARSRNSTTLKRKNSAGSPKKRIKSALNLSKLTYERRTAAALYGGMPDLQRNYNTIVAEMRATRLEHGSFIPRYSPDVPEASPSPDVPKRQPGTKAILADALTGHWTERLPDHWKPYARLARLDRPVGWWLLLWPCWWSSLMATNGPGYPPNLLHLVLFLIGAIVMRGAGCTYNDILDRDIDAAVLRTRDRPLPSGQVTVGEAIVFLFAQALVGLIVLLQFNTQTILLGLVSLVVVAIYPLAKRVVDWPQLFLGIAFSWGALLGWTAAYGRLQAPAILLFAGGLMWTVGYDTIYAHQDREDDELIGIRSTARLFGHRTWPFLVVIYAGATAFIGWAFWMAGLGIPAFVGLAAGAVQLGWQIVILDIEDPANCLRVFRSNQYYGWIVFGGLLADSIVTMVLRIF
jgi:4-hydroxybenzoate polyprenyltransferase